MAAIPSTRTKAKARTLGSPRLLTIAWRVGRWGLCEDLSGLREGGDRERGEERERGGEAVKFGHCRVSFEFGFEALILRCRAALVWTRRSQKFQANICAACISAAAAARAQTVKAAAKLIILVISVSP